MSSSINIQWIPKHSDIPGYQLPNEHFFADRTATTNVTSTILPISLSRSLHVINKKTRESLPTHERVAQVYQHRKACHDSKQIMNWEDGTLLARPQSGHHSSWHQYLHLLDQAKDPCFHQELKHFRFNCMFCACFVICYCCIVNINNCTCITRESWPFVFFWCSKGEA